MEIRLLGPLEVRAGGHPVEVRRAQQRALLAALALRPGRVVSTERLVAELWGERAPASATGSLQNAVSELRKLLPRDALVTKPPGYRLALEPDGVDALAFERLLSEAHEAAPAEKAALLRRALALWRGEALADVDEDFARLEAARLEELRVAALEDRVDAELELGRHAALVAELEALVAEHPLRERLRGQLMLALYRCGRQAEALEVYRATRLALADELGLDPSPELQALERRMLRQDPDLRAPADRAAQARPDPAAEVQLVTVLAAVPPAADDPEQHHRRLEETLRSAREVLDRHGGVLERFGAEGLVALFGADRPADDDARRAVLAARELGLPAGVATGDVVLGAGTVVTRAVELARDGDGIALDARTQALARAERRLDAPLVGRDGELERLVAALAATRDDRRCRVLTVLGEPGIGKTRLARELAGREGAGTTVLEARCAAHGDAVALGPLLEGLRGADRESMLEPEPDAELVLARLRALTNGEASAVLGESFWALRRLLETLAREQPLLLVLDDLQWAEPALLDLVDYLAARAEGAILLLCLARPELERPPGERLVLQPLGEEHAREIIAGVGDVDEATADRIVALAEGNALYVEQLTAFAAEGGEGLPPTLEAVLAGRLGQLDAAERIVLQRAAVVGRDFSLASVAALADEDVSAPLLVLSRAGFVHPAPATEPGDDGFSFHHMLLRDAAYAGLTRSDRRVLHERLAAWLDREERGDDGLVGRHLEQAARYRRLLGEPADELAALAGERLGRAALHASRSNDTATAVGLLTRATALLPPGERRGELLWELALALRVTGAAAEAEVALERAEADARAFRHRPLRARVAAEAAWTQLAAGGLGLAEAVAEMLRAVAVLEEARDERGLGRALLATAAVHMFACNFDELERTAAEAAAQYVLAGVSPAACVSAQAEALYLGPTPVQTAKRRCAELLELAPDRVSAALVSAVLGALHALEGDAAQGRELLDGARALVDDLGNSFTATTILDPLELDLEVCAGRPDRAEAVARASLERLEAGGTANRAYTTSRALDLAGLLLDAGRLEEAEPLVSYAELDAVESDVYAQFFSRCLRARILAARGDGAGAVERAREAVALSSCTDGLRYRARTHLVLAEALELAGAGGEGRRERAEAARLLREKGATALLRSPAPAALARP